MTGTVKDWYEAHGAIITDASTAVLGVTVSMAAAIRSVVAERSLASPAVRQAFSRISAEAASCEATMNRSLALPSIPDAGKEFQFRYTMGLSARYAAAAQEIETAAANDLDDVLARVISLQGEVVSQITLLDREFRKAWPADPLGPGKRDIS
jgi:hypothetical protein